MKPKNTKMKYKGLKTIIYIALISNFFSCSNNGDLPKFNPNKNKDTDLQDQGENAKLIAEKKIKFEKDQGKSEVKNLLQFDGKVKLTVMIPNDQQLTEVEMKTIENKLIQMVTANGIGGLGGNPRFVIAPVVNILKKDATSTAPIKYLIKYEVYFYVADILTGNIYGSTNIQFTSVEESEDRAFIDGFGKLNPSENNFQDFLKTSQEKIIKYYEENGNKIITEATSLANQKKYEQAIALLESIPMEATEPYNNASKIMPKIFQNYLNNDCETTLALMKSSLGTYNEKSAAGFNSEAMGYYKMVPAGGNCKKEADRLYEDYKKNLNPQKIKDWEQSEKEWTQKVNQSNSDNEFRKLQEELKAKIAIEGNVCLLDKYKKDANYNKLPWLRKLIHLGDYDPFDGNKINKNCN